MMRTHKKNNRQNSIITNDMTDDIRDTHALKTELNQKVRDEDGGRLSRRGADGGDFDQPRYRNHGKAYSARSNGHGDCLDGKERQKSSFAMIPGARPVHASLQANGLDPDRAQKELHSGIHDPQLLKRGIVHT